MSASTIQQKRRHHFVPVAYLSGFANSQNKIVAYRKDEPSTPLIVDPKSIAFERYYYSQPLPNGGQDNNRLEDLFGTVESTWPPIVERIRRRLDINHDLEAIFMFMSMMRVRVPAMRDLYETALAETVKIRMRHLDRLGHLPPKPEGHEDILDHLRVSIDPHRSIHAMPDLVRAFFVVLDQIGFQIVHNEAGSSFVTSDNPVIYFDPTIDELQMTPYGVRPCGGQIELLFPIDSQTVLHGLSELKADFSRNGARHVPLTSRHDLKKINRLISRFGYRFIFASSGAHEPLVRKYAAQSPVLSAAASGNDPFSYQQVFGPRPCKPKWNIKPPPTIDLASI
jgi:hypothetical protein